jgi:hypothetical protein
MPASCAAREIACVRGRGRREEKWWNETVSVGVRIRCGPGDACRRAIGRCCAGASYRGPGGGCGPHVELRGERGSCGSGSGSRAPGTGALAVPHGGGHAHDRLHPGRRAGRPGHGAAGHPVAGTSCSRPDGASTHGRRRCVRGGCSGARGHRHGAYGVRGAVGPAGAGGADRRVRQAARPLSRGGTGAVRGGARPAAGRARHPGGGCDAGPARGGTGRGARRAGGAAGRAERRPPRRQSR